MTVTIIIAEENMSTEVAVIVGVVVGLVVAVALFGLIYLIAVLPEIKAKKGKKQPDVTEIQPENEEETVVQNLEEEAMEEAAAENSAQYAEEPEEVAETVEEVAGTAVEEKEKEEEKEPEPVKEEIKEEPAKVEKPVKEEESEEEPEEEEEDDVEDNESEKEKEVRLAAIESAPELEQGQRYNRSYKARLIQSSDTVKGWYSQIKNAALSYKGVKSSVSWRQEKVTKGRVQLIKIALRGKTLSVYFPLEVSKIKNYDVEDVSDKSVHAATPCLLRVKKEAHVNQAIDLVSQAAAKLVLEETAAKKTDYVKEYKLETTEQLIEEGLVKVVGGKK